MQRDLAERAVVALEQIAISNERMDNFLARLMLFVRVACAEFPVDDSDNDADDYNGDGNVEY